MGTAFVAIAALAIACAVVLAAIFAVLRTSRRTHSAPAPTEMPVGELARRIRDAQPLQLRQPPAGFLGSDEGPFGRMMEPASPPKRLDSGFGASGVWGASQQQQQRQQRSGAVAQAPHLGSGPLVPLRQGSPLSPLPRFGSDPAGAGVFPSGTSGALGGSGGLGPSWPTSVSGGSSSGRIPGFAIEDTLAAVLGPAPRGLDPAREQRLREAAYVYDDGIRVAFDPQLDAVDLIFAACPLTSEQEVALAFYMLNERFQTLLRSVGRDRTALVVDVAGLSISAEVTETWIQGLRQFLLARCSQAGPGRLLLARYNSRVRVAGDKRPSLQRIAAASATAALNSQTQIFGSRDEAAALILRLRELAAIPG